jgi:hypothetical protein
MCRQSCFHGWLVDVVGLSISVQAPVNEGAGAPRDPAKTFDANTEDPYWTYSRGGIVDRKDGQKGREPFVSDLDKK